MEVSRIYKEADVQYVQGGDSYPHLLQAVEGGQHRDIQAGQGALQVKKLTTVYLQNIFHNIF